MLAEMAAIPGYVACRLMGGPQRAAPRVVVMRENYVETPPRSCCFDRRGRSWKCVEFDICQESSEGT